MHIDTDIAVILPCRVTEWEHSCEEHQGVWLTRICNEPSFYCRHHGIMAIAIRLLMHDVPVTKIAHLDVGMLTQIVSQLRLFGMEAYMDTPDYDRRAQFNTYVTKLNMICRTIERLIDQKSAQLTLI